MRGSTRMLRWWPRVLRIYDESGRAVRVRVRYLVLLLVAVGFLGFSAVYLPVAMTSVPGFCDNCHLMVEPAELWKESTHSNVNCVECHVNPGFVSEIEHKILSYKEIYAQFFGGGHMPEDIHTPTNASCLQCHYLDREVSPGGDLKIPHREHVEMRDLMCADCHFNVVHSRRGEPGGPPPMDVCYMCHDGDRAPNACSTCHRDPPDENKVHPEGAIQNHGKLARDRTEDCFRCHSERSGFCEDCHKKPPESHTAQDWRYMHNKTVQKEGRSGCNGCHEQEFCDRCHTVQHPPNWVKSHRQFAQSGGEPCYVCHSPGFCQECHEAEQIGSQ